MPAQCGFATPLGVYFAAVGPLLVRRTAVAATPGDPGAGVVSILSEGSMRAEWDAASNSIGRLPVLPVGVAAASVPEPAVPEDVEGASEAATGVTPSAASPGEASSQNKCG